MSAERSPGDRHWDPAAELAGGSGLLFWSLVDFRRHIFMSGETLTALVGKATFESSFSTLDMKVEVLQSSKRDPRKGALAESRVEQRYVETKAGHRLFDNLGTGKDGWISHYAGYCDGKRCAYVEYDHKVPGKQVAIGISHKFMGEMKHGFLESPEPYRFSHVGLVPLREALPKAERAGSGEVIGRTCEVFHFKAVGTGAKPQLLAYYLDRATAVPLKVVAYDGPDQLRDDSPNWQWEATSLDSVGKHHFPLGSTYTSFVRLKGSGGKAECLPQTFQTIKVTSIKYDAPVAESTFWPVYQPGLEVDDHIAHQTIKVPGGEAQTKKEQHTGTPIEVPESRSGTTGLVVAGLGLSLAVLLAAFLLWRRAR